MLESGAPIYNDRPTIGNTTTVNGTNVFMHSGIGDARVGMHRIEVIMHNNISNRVTRYERPVGDVRLQGFRAALLEARRPVPEGGEGRRPTRFERTVRLLKVMLSFATIFLGITVRCASRATHFERHAR